MEKINCIIIEDKVEDGEYLQSLIAKYDSLSIKAKFSNPLFDHYSIFFDMRFEYIRPFE